MRARCQSRITVAHPVRRLLEALDYLGEPLLDAEDRAAALAALESGDAAGRLAEAQRLLDAHCLAGVHVNPERRVKVQRGPAEARLVEQGWRTFLVKVHNEAGVTTRLAASSPSAAPVFARRDGAEVRTTITDSAIEERWMELPMMDGQPMTPTLSGLALEYRLLQVFSRDAGRREATLSFDVGQGTQGWGNVSRPGRSGGEPRQGSSVNSRASLCPTPVPSGWAGSSKKHCT